ncbi:interleukin-18 isoform X2 [Peromyscus californicus insignis]|uniref:interleukin-18 isoform X2 n=1 Tax=Peromyscus californicus insignis TaxID=564181 RepID=UPI0022A69229|nr:interleukin-18 isoform X2 [Peromyscus californicus insignis]XP_052616024.1 interleukin-18 isoform X2 [Peromyscus californicus insignis]
MSSSHRRLLDPHPDCRLSGSPCSLYSRLPAPAADRAATLYISSVSKRKEVSELPDHFLLEGTIDPGENCSTCHPTTPLFPITQVPFPSAILLAVFKINTDSPFTHSGITMAAVPEGFCINFKEMIFIDNTLYFMPEDDGDLESDHFGRDCSTTAVIRNMDDQVLFVDRNKQQHVFEDMTDADIGANEPQTRLIIFMYKDDKVRGLPVTLSVKDTKMFTLSCKDKIISFKEMDPPENINATESDLIFFQRGVPGHDKMQFESSLYKGYFLAYEKDGDLFKLILKKKDENGDKSVMFTLTNLRRP